MTYKAYSTVEHNMVLIVTEQTEYTLIVGVNK